MPRFNSPIDVQAHFYRAIEAGDSNAMMQAWSKNDPVVCIHPGAPRLDEYELIEQSWEHILAGEANLSFKLSEEQRIENSELAIFTARVNISLDGEWIDTLLTTNVYKFSGNSWLMIVHHASPDPTFDEDEAPDELIELEDETDMVLH